MLQALRVVLAMLSERESIDKLIAVKVVLFATLG